MPGTISGFEVGTAELPPSCPDAPLPPGETGPQSGIVDILPGFNQVTIIFDEPYLNVPYPPDVTILKPSNSSEDIFFLNISSLTTDGCIANFSAPAPASGYKASYKVAPNLTV